VGLENKRTMKNLLFISFVALIATSCVTQRRCDKLFPPETRIKDSTVLTYKDSTIEKVEVKTITKDSIVYTAATKDSGEVETSENSTYKFKNDKVSIKLIIKDGKVKYFVDVSATESRYSTKIDSLSKLVEKYKSKDSLVVKGKEVVRQAVEPKIPWYTKLYGYAKDILALIGLIYLLILLFRMVVKKLAG
jgi:hypothetical protein